MTCRELDDFLGDYFEGSLPEQVRVSFEAHLAVCPPCAVYLEQYREAVRLGRTSREDEEVGADVPEELIRAILASR